MHHKALQEPRKGKVLVILFDIRRCLKMRQTVNTGRLLTSKAWSVNDGDNFDIKREPLLVEVFKP